MNFREFITKVDFRIGEAILVILVVLQFLDFFEVLPADADFVKKIISWTVLGYLLYQASLTRIFFGNRNKTLDIILILTYFTLIVNKFVGYAHSAVLAAEESSYITPFFYLILENQEAIHYWSFFIGGLALIIIAIYIGTRLRFNSPSVVSIFHQEGYPEKNTFAKRAILTFIILNVFFLTIFNLMSEWLAIAIDAPIVFIGVLIYIFYIVRHARKFNADSIIYKLGTFADNFYEDFIKHFKYKGTLLLGFGGMLVLHLLTDIANFILPYVFGLKDELYLSKLGSGHSSLLTFLNQELVGKSIIDLVSIVFIRLMNVLMIVLLMIMPVLLWYLIYYHKTIRISKKYLFLFALAFPSILTASTFTLKKINLPGLVGVDIQSLPTSTVIPVSYVLLFSVAISLLVLTLSYFRKIEKYLIIIFIIFSQFYFGVYIYHYYHSILNMYLSQISYLAGLGDYFLLFYMVLFLVITTLFYIGGFIFFELEIIKKLKHYIRF